MNRQRKWKKVLAGVSVFALTASMVPSGMTSVFAAELQNAEQGMSGTPYTADGAYDVTAPHVIINQVYGGSDDGAASHSFIELYNQSTESVDLTGWRIAYRSSADGDNSESWEYLDLAGSIDGNGYYLIRCGAANGTDYEVPAGDQDWEIQLHNKGVSVVLLSEQTELAFAGAVTDENRPEGYVDLLAVQGNDAGDEQMPPVYETAVNADQSKKKSVRRDNFQDTDNNAEDSSVVDYSEEVPEEEGPHSSSMNESGEPGTYQP